GERAEAALVALVRAADRGADQLQADRQLHIEIALLRLHPLAQVAVPGEKVIDPAFDGEEVEAELLDRDLALPAVVDQGAHRHFAPLPFRLMAMQRDRADQVVAVGEDVRLDEDVLSLDPLRRKAAIVDLRRYAFDDDALSTVKRLHCPGMA